LFLKGDHNEDVGALGKFFGVQAIGVKGINKGSPISDRFMMYDAEKDRLMHPALGVPNDNVPNGLVSTVAPANTVEASRDRDMVSYLNGQMDGAEQLV
jgi:hypothetical protein